MKKKIIDNAEYDYDQRRVCKINSVVQCQLLYLEMCQPLPGAPLHGETYIFLNLMNFTAEKKLIDGTNAIQYSVELSRVLQEQCTDETK